MAKRKINEYYKKQKLMCKSLGIKPPPQKASFIQKFKYIYKELTKHS